MAARRRHHRRQHLRPVPVADRRAQPDRAAGDHPHLAKDEARCLPPRTPRGVAAAARLRQPHPWGAGPEAHQSLLADVPAGHPVRAGLRYRQRGWPAGPDRRGRHRQDLLLGGDLAAAAVRGWDELDGHHRWRADEQGLRLGVRKPAQEDLVQHHHHRPVGRRRAADRHDRDPPGPQRPTPLAWRVLRLPQRQARFRRARLHHRGHVPGRLDRLRAAVEGPPRRGALRRPHRRGVSWPAATPNAGSAVGAVVACLPERPLELLPRLLGEFLVLAVRTPANGIIRILRRRLPPYTLGDMAAMDAAIQVQGTSDKRHGTDPAVAFAPRSGFLTVCSCGSSDTRRIAMPYQPTETETTSIRPSYQSPPPDFAPSESGEALVIDPIVTDLPKVCPSTTNWIAFAVLLQLSVCQALSAKLGPAVRTALPADPWKKQLALPVVRPFLATISSL